MSADKPGGWSLGSVVGRLFNGGNKKEEHSPASIPVVTNGTSHAHSSPLKSAVEAKKLLKEITAENGTSSPAHVVTGKSSRYLSPSTIDGVRFTETASTSNDLYASTASRKRQLTDDRPSTALDELIFRDNAKRFRGLSSNMSMMEPSNATKTWNDRLDASWAGSGVFDYSPSSSTQSFRSRVSQQGQASSVLSSKTRAILDQLQKISTPSRDAARKMPMLRQSAAEKWAPLNASAVSTPPPLRRQGGAVPSRVQLLSSVMASSQKKPYWRDLSRQKASSSTQSEAVGVESVTRLVQTAVSRAPPPTSNVCSLFDMDSGKKSASTFEKRHEPVLKTVERKSANTFSARALDEEEEDSTWLSEAAALPTFAPPTKGFLDDAVFSFAAPSARGPSEVTHVSSSEKSSDEEDDSGSDCDSGSSSESDDEDQDEKKKSAPSSRPPTSTDSVSSAVTPASSKNTSPLSSTTPKITVSTDEEWDCPECMCKGRGNECPVCNYKKDGSKSSGESVFGAAKFNPTPAPSGGFSFGLSASSTTAKSDASKSTVGFGAVSMSEKTEAQAKPLSGSCSPAAPVPAPAPVVASSESLWSCGTCFVSNKESDDKCVACSEPSPNAKKSTAVERKAWDCPDCFVGNKATDDKCMACGHVMYKSEGDSAPKSAFGANAFKPIAPVGGASFGFVSAPTSGGVSFGLAPKKNEDKKDEPVKPAIGVEATSISKTNSNESDKSGVSLFGAGSSSITTTSLFGAPKPASDKPTSTPLFGAPSIPPTSASTASVSETSKPLFGAPSSGSLFGASAKPLFGAPTAPAESTKDAALSGSATPIFGASTAGSTSTTATTSEPAKFPSLFGAPSAKVPVTTTALFGAKSAETVVSTAATVTATSTVPLFGSASGGPSLFGSSKPAFSLGGDDKPAATPVVASTPLFGAPSATDAPKTSIFGAAASTINTAKADDSAPAEKKPFMFGSTPAPAAAPFSFGSTSAASTAPTFGASSSTPAFAFGGSAQSLSASSSTNSLSAFGATPVPAVPAPATGGFNFGAAPAAPSTGFNFGEASATPSTGAFQFGAAPAAPTGGAFQFGSTPAAAPSTFAFGAPSLDTSSSGGAFAFNSSAGSSSVASSGRKMATARRRAPVRR